MTVVADPSRYLLPLREELQKTWPDNRAIHIVCHGHSVPAGYFASPVVLSIARKTDNIGQ